MKNRIYNRKKVIEYAQIINHHHGQVWSRQLSSYNFQKARFIKIDGVNIW